MPGTTPLLLLLDGISSSDVERVEMSVSEIRTLLTSASPCPTMTDPTTQTTLGLVDEPVPAVLASVLSPWLQQQPQVSNNNNNDESNSIINEDDEIVATRLLQSTPLLVSLIQHVLQVFPHWAQTCSARDGSLPLHFAANLGSVAVANVLLDFYPQAASTPNAKGKIALHYAAREGRIELVDFLLQKDPHTAAIASKKDKLALHFAAGEGHEQVVHSLLRVYPQGASLPSAKGKVPLHFAARWNHINIAQELLHLFPDGIRAMDWEGSLPLHDAARQGQSDMARLLVERFPLALCVQNLRGEVPLFPAARSGSVDLVAYLVQAWPEGSKQVLQSLSKDDRIDSWNWDILELLLRGASQHLDDDESPVLQGRDPPTVRLVGDINTVSSAASATAAAAAAAASQDATLAATAKIGKDGKSKNKKSKDKKNQACGTIEDRQARLVDTSTHAISIATTLTTKRSKGNKDEMGRSKSPILDDSNPKKRHRDSSSDESTSDKRIRLEDFGCSNSSTDSEKETTKHPPQPSNNSGSGATPAQVVPWESRPQASKPPRPPRVFLPLHAALQSGASIHVLDHVLQMQPHDIQQMDEHQRYPLHWAVAWAKTKAQVVLVMEKIFQAFPQAALQRTWLENQLPLHIALAATAPELIIKALLQAHPTSAVQPCRTHDEWHDQKPLHMACRHGCSVGALYELLRVDPSLVPSSSSASPTTRRCD